MMPILKLFTTVLLATLVCCEPPVYRPHQNGYNRPSNNYLPPNPGFNLPNTYLPPHTGYPTDFNGHGQGHGQNHGHDHHGHGDESEVRARHGIVPSNSDKETSMLSKNIPKAYEFGYSVKDAATGNDYDRREMSDGNEVRGEYRVQLPDGRTQIVSYHADWQTGFHADVRYEGEAHYPQNNNLGYNTGYNYNTPDYSGSLSGFHGNQQLPKPSYGPPSFH